ncbi:MAG: NADH-quinone oxidoreductase subunit M [bacterium]|jgi:NADH-quinone oxidoreductase subunit M|nr:NADH-quinone oxidoreductase subunit M [bacterium]
MPLLSSILMVPTITLLAILLVPGRAVQVIRWLCALCALTTAFLSVQLWMGYDPGAGGIQFVEKIPWVSGMGISYHVGVDGFGIVLVMLNSIVFLTGVLTMWDLQTRVKEFFAFMVLLVIGVYGVFVSQDMFFFFFFYEIAVVPMYPLIIIWGSGNKEYAAMKLMLFLLAGSALLFPGLLAIYHHSGLHTFDLVLLSQHTFDPEFQIFVYPFIYIGFGVLAGMFPFHGWSPTGHVAAPSAVSMLHAGVLMKLGAFGVLSVGIRLLPEGAIYWAPTFCTFAAVGIVYGAFVAIRQTDFKFVIGFSSVSHMGIVLLGLNLAVLGKAGSDALNGAVFQMFAHGIMTALFFSTVGFIYDRAHSKTIADFGGLGSQMPRAVSIFVVAGLCGAGLPGLASFWAELLVFLAAIKTYPIIGVAIIIGLVLTAVYILRVFTIAFFGPPNDRWDKLREVDLSGYQLMPRAILVAVLVYFGFVPRAMLDIINSTTTAFLGKF